MSSAADVYVAIVWFGLFVGEHFLSELTLIYV